MNLWGQLWCGSTSQIIDYLGDVYLSENDFNTESHVMNHSFTGTEVRTVRLCCSTMGEGHRLSHTALKSHFGKIMALILRACSIVLLKVLLLHIFHFLFAGQLYERQHWPLYDLQKYDTSETITSGSFPKLALYWVLLSLLCFVIMVGVQMRPKPWGKCSLTSLWPVGLPFLAPLAFMIGPPFA